MGRVGGLGRKGLSSSPILLVTQETQVVALVVALCGGGEEMV